MLETSAAALFDLIEPELAERVHAVRQDEPALPESGVVDRALRQALAHLSFDVSEQTFLYLRWRADRARAAAAAAVAASVEARRARHDARHDARQGAPTAGACAHAEPGLGADPGPRTFRAAGAGDVWSVREVEAAAVPWARGSRCLLFESESAIRRVWRFPVDWRRLPDPELEALSWRT